MLRRLASVVVLILVLMSISLYSVNAVAIKFVWPIPLPYTSVGYMAVIRWFFFPTAYRLVIFHVPRVNLVIPFAYRVNLPCHVSDCGIYPISLDKLKELIYADDEYIEAIARTIRYISYNSQYLMAVITAELTRSLVYRGRSGYESIPRWPRDTLISGYGVCYDAAITMAAILNKAGVKAALVVGTVEVDGKEYGHAQTAVSIGPAFNRAPIYVYIEPLGKRFYILDGTMEARERPILYPRFVDIGNGYKFKKVMLVIYDNETWVHTCYSSTDCRWEKLES